MFKLLIGLLKADFKTKILLKTLLTKIKYFQNIWIVKGNKGFSKHITPTVFCTNNF